MLDAFRQRVRQAAEAAQAQSQKRIYDSVRISWQGQGLNKAIPKRRLASSEITHLTALSLSELTMEQLVSLGDHIEVTGLVDVEPELIASVANASDALRLPPLVDDGVSGKEIGKKAAMRFAFWAGYIAAPALRSGRFQDAVELLAYLTRRLAEPDYEGVDGGGGSTDPSMRFLILAPALAGLTQYCPPLIGGHAGHAGGCLSNYFQQMTNLAPLTECVLLRLACLGIVARHPAVLPFLEEARIVAGKRYEKDLADAFKLFRDNPDLLGDWPGLLGDWPGLLDAQKSPQTVAA